MGRRSVRNHPESATVLHTFAALREYLTAFAAGGFALLGIIGHPGLTKSRHVRRTIEGTNAGYFKGYVTPLKLYAHLYQYQDRPLVFDDTNNLFQNKDTRSTLRDLTETDTYKRIEYGSTSRILEQENLPAHFNTTSPVCFVTNYWDAGDPVFQALESRAHLFVIDVSWEELHRDVAEWFWDQEIYNYIQDRLHLLGEPDARLYVKAWELKRSNLKLTPWKGYVDGHCDDHEGRIIRELLGQEFGSDNQRYQRYVEIVQADDACPLARSNFYARVRTIRDYLPTTPLPRIELTHSTPPVEARPPDGMLPRPVCAETAGSSHDTSVTTQVSA